MSAASANAILIAVSDVDDRLLECVADCHATLVRTFDEAQRALRERLFKMVVIDLNFDNVRMFDLLQHVRSLADFNGVPVLCVQRSEAGSGVSAALDRLVRMLGGKAFIDLRSDDEGLANAFKRLCQVVGAELGMDNSRDCGGQSQRGEVGRAAAKKQARATDAAARERLCILVIDADADAAQRLGDIVEEIGHDADFAYDGAAGIDAARRLRPDVVFVDLDSPRLDGCQVARRLRGEPGLRGVLIIALAGAANADYQRMREAGFDHHVVKPAERHLIRSLLARLVARPAR